MSSEAEREARENIYRKERRCILNALLEVENAKRAVKAVYGSPLGGAMRQEFMQTRNGLIMSLGRLEARREALDP
jgi:hypothetical protein